MKLPPALAAKVCQLAGLAQPRQTEADFTAAVIGLANGLGWQAAHFRGVRIQRPDGSVYWQTPVQGDGAGFPDLLLVRHRLIVAELKVGRNKPTAEQMAWLASFERCGIPAYVWTPGDWSEIEAVLRG